MPKIKYEKYKNSFIATAFIDDGSSLLEISLDEIKHAYLFIGTEKYAVRDGKAEINLTKIRENRYTPLIKSDQEVCLCDAIAIFAGRVRLDFPEQQRLLFLTSELIEARKEISKAVEDIKRLCESVYEKKIF
ncbi:MAG: hypothetical protein IKV16_01020 [Clostridia bacterium]|nr:hypothetical protein [Clostridia bacterium]